MQVTTAIKRLWLFSQNKLILLSVLGLLVRYALGVYTSWHDNVEWYNVGVNSIYNVSLYERGGFAYPPVWGYVLEFSSRIGGLFFNPAGFAHYSPQLESASSGGAIWGISPTVTSPVFNLIFKTPLFIVEIYRRCHA
jgi:hypothetical protein